MGAGGGAAGTAGGLRWGQGATQDPLVPWTPDPGCRERFGDILRLEFGQLGGGKHSAMDVHMCVQMMVILSEIDFLWTGNFVAPLN
jgi:hypothetical protein